METKEEIEKMRKRNLKIFPIYRALSWDYLFYYTIDFLFFTQVKNISAAFVVLMEAFYSFFKIVFQIPANIVVEFIGRRNSIILANVLNCMYMFVIISSQRFGDLIFAEFLRAVALALKDIAEPSLLGGSIPPSKSKSKIYSKMIAKGSSRYYAINSISKIVAGFLFAVNGFLPIIISLIILILVTILSIGFIEPINGKKERKELSVHHQLEEIRLGFIYVLKSERLKALILCSALIATLLRIAYSYHLSLLEDLQISSKIIGVIAALGGIIGALASRNQDKVHNKLRNKTLISIAILLSFSCIIAGVCGLIAQVYMKIIAIIILMYLLYYFCEGIYFIIIDKYLSSFANHKIDTKIFATNNLIKNLIQVLGMLFASFLLDKTTTSYALIIIGILFTYIYIILQSYMKTRVGLRPEEYSKEETKYDEQKLLINTKKER